MGDGHLFEAGRLLTFPTYRVGAYSRLGAYVELIRYLVLLTMIGKAFRSKSSGNDDRYFYTALYSVSTNMCMYLTSGLLCTQCQGYET